MENQKFNKPVLEIVNLDNTDVIATSGPLTVREKLFKSNIAEKLGTFVGDDFQN